LEIINRDRTPGSFTLHFEITPSDSDTIQPLISVPSRLVLAAGHIEKTQFEHWTNHARGGTRHMLPTTHRIDRAQGAGAGSEQELCANSGKGG
jgi:hypothetical protein